MKLLKDFVAEPLTPAASLPATQPAETEEQTVALKERFAEMLYRGGEAFAVALALTQNTTRSLRMAAEWPSDPQVKTLLESFRQMEDEGDTRFLPSKSEHIKWLRDKANEAARIADFSAASQFARLLTNVLGFEQQKASVEINNNTQVNRVMVMRDHGSNDDWERKAMEQQARLKTQVLEHAS
jgi:hypothetical protein